jgi:hypothetical protein
LELACNANDCELFATVTVGKKAEVEAEEKEVTSVPDRVSVPPFSVNTDSFVMQ